MRVLVTTTGSAGHFGPLVPFADALQRAGDDVLVAVRESRAASIDAAGYAVAPIADAPADERGALFGQLRELSPDAANRHVIGEIFGRLDTRSALPGVLDACEEFRPDLILSETCEFAGGLAAERLGLPGVRVGIGLGASEALFMPIAGAALEEIRDVHGLAADPGAARMCAAPFFTLTPPALEVPGMLGPRGARRFRDYGPCAAPLPDWWPGDERPLVYLTLGSVAPGMGSFPGLFRTAIDALADLPIRLLVTVGRDCDPAELGPCRDGVRVERWVAQGDVMPETAAIVCHGGFGTVRAALAAGVPLAVLPLFADQPYNARRVAELGAGIALDGAAGLRDAVEALLADGSYAAAAAEVANDVLALPPVDTAANVLRELAAR